MENLVKRACFVLSVLFLSANLNIVFGQTQLKKNLEKGIKQRIVVYGTSLSARLDGWPAMLSDTLNTIYPGLVDVVNSAHGAKWSTWGVENLRERVLEKHPDVVMIEFGINDAHRPFKTSVAAAKLNLNYMIDRILELNPKCEIILQVMNSPTGVHAQNRPHIEDYYDMYRKVAKKRKLKLIDHSTYWNPIMAKGVDEFKKWAPDGLHPEEKAWHTFTVPYLVKELVGKK